MARNKHSRAPMKGQTCIECHKGIAHLEPDEPGMFTSSVKDTALEEEDETISETDTTASDETAPTSAE
jgi:hypothetical protein